MRKFEDYKIDTEYGRIAVRDDRGSGLPVLFLHGSGFSKDVFHAQFGEPALSGFRLIALDLPGHGSSDDAVQPTQTYTVAGLADAVAASIRHLGISGCIVAGWSLGGHVAMELLAKPSHGVSGVAAFGAPPLPHGPLGMIRGFHFTLDMLLASKARLSYLEARRFERLALGAQSDGRFVEGIVRTDRRLRPLLSRDMLMGKGSDQLKTVLASTVPVCLIQGENDPLVRTGYVRTVRGPALYQGGCHVIANSGHAPFMEQPGTFNTLLARFAVDAEAQIANRSEETAPMRMAG